MTASDWYDLRTRTIAMYLSGHDTGEVDAHGQPVVDDSFLVILHAGLGPTTFTLPGAPWAAAYEVVLDNTDTLGGNAQPGQALDVPGVAFVVLRAT